MLTSEKVKEFALDHGASLVGIASVDRFGGAPVGHGPEDLVPGAKSVISMAIRLPDSVVEWDDILKDSEIIEDEDVRLNVIQTHYYGRCGYQTMNNLLEQLGLRVTLFLDSHGNGTKRSRSMFFPATYASDAPIMEKVPGFFAPFSHRHAAVRAGLGEFGYNNLVITPQYGPRIRLMSVITTHVLEADPLLSEPVCLGEKCLLCVKKCAVDVFSVDTKREGSSLFMTMPSIMAKVDCYSKHRPAGCWGHCIQACPVGR